MAWREFWSLTSMCYPTPYSFLLFYIDMPLIPPSLRQAREIKTGRSMSLIPSLRADDSVHWCFLLVISKKQHNDLSVCTRPVPHTQHGTQKSLTKRLKELLFLHFFFFSPAFLVKAPKPLDAYDAVPDAQSSITRHCMSNSAILREHLPLGSVFQPFGDRLLQLGVISQTIRGVDLCVVLRCHGFTCWPH